MGRHAALARGRLPGHARPGGAGHGGLPHGPRLRELLRGGGLRGRGGCGHQPSPHPVGDDGDLQGLDHQARALDVQGGAMHEPAWEARRASGDLRERKDHLRRHHRGRHEHGGPGADHGSGTLRPAQGEVPGELGRRGHGPGRVQPCQHAAGAAGLQAVQAQAQPEVDLRGHRGGHGARAHRLLLLLVPGPAARAGGRLPGDACSGGEGDGGLPHA
mmetsp:Transcript_51000/g.148031  ORF Transcript_51000/g.148031 Transcript_51000/m.148031 type:complete len:216 (+) Transcript_51000:525-1172(+)